jgi:hypothetical protein
MATAEELKNAQNAANANPATTGADKVNAMYDAQKAAQLNQLQSAYEQSKSEYTAAQAKIAPQYQNAANALAVEQERNKRNFNQQAAASGLNTGTASQAALAQNSANQREMGALRTAEADAQAEAARQLANFEDKYQADVAAAIANNDYQRAAALYDEFKNAQNMDLKNAQILAEFGDFSGYARLYGEDQAKNMFYIWAAQNPQLAFNSGRITEAQYNNLLAGKPINAVQAAGAAAGAGGPWAYGGSGWNPTNNTPVPTTGYMGTSATGGNAMYQDPADALASYLATKK